MCVCVCVCVWGGCSDLTGHLENQNCNMNAYRESWLARSGMTRQ